MFIYSYINNNPLNNYKLLHFCQIISYGVKYAEIHHNEELYSCILQQIINLLTRMICVQMYKRVQYII